MGKARVDKGTSGQRGRIPPPGSVLAVLAVVLLALGAAALAAARGSAERGTGPLLAQWWLFAGVAFIAGLAVVVRLRRLVNTADTGSSAESRLHRGALALAAIATAAVPFAFFLIHEHPSDRGAGSCPGCPVILRTGGQRPTGGQQTPVPARTALSSPTHLPLGTLLVIFGSVLVALAVGVLLAALINWWSRRGEGPAVGPAPAPPPEDEQDASALSMAVLAGRGALEGEARAAIISCYAAMEASLAEAGVPRLASDSPADLLGRATEHGVLDGPAPALLAALFREARFSSHSMRTAHLDQARGALDEIAAQLTARAEAVAQAKAAAAAQATANEAAADAGAAR